jgi:hypothetical protein
MPRVSFKAGAKARRRSYIDRMRWMAPLLFLTACAAKIDGTWQGRHESATEQGYVETLALGDDGRFERNAQYADPLACVHIDLASGSYEWIGPMRLRFFVDDGRALKRCDPSMASYDRTISSEVVDCNVTPKGDTLFLDCGTGGWTNRCFQRSMPADDCVPKATDR